MSFFSNPLNQLNAVAPQRYSLAPSDEIDLTNSFASTPLPPEIWYKIFIARTFG